MSRFLVVLFSFTMAGLLYVYTEVEAVKMGYTIRKQEEVKTHLLDQSRTLRFSLANLKSPSHLEKSLEARRVALESPKSWNQLVMPSSQQKVSPKQSWPVFFGKFFIGTAQAEAQTRRAE